MASVRPSTLSATHLTPTVTANHATLATSSRESAVSLAKLAASTSTAPPSRTAYARSVLLASTRPQMVLASNSTHFVKRSIQYQVDAPRATLATCWWAILVPLELDLLAAATPTAKKLTLTRDARNATVDTSYLHKSLV